MQYQRYDITVGIFFLLTVISAFFLAALPRHKDFFWTRDDSYVLTGVFQNVGQLTIGAVVKSSGVSIGHVSSIRFDTKRYEAIVEMKIDKKYQFPIDSSLSIMTSGLLGGQFISLEAGLDSHYLKSGDRIIHTQSAWILEKLLSQLVVNRLNK